MRVDKKADRWKKETMDRTFLERKTKASDLAIRYPILPILQQGTRNIQSSGPGSCTSSFSDIRLIDDSILLVEPTVVGYACVCELVIIIIYQYGDRFYNTAVVLVYSNIVLLALDVLLVMTRMALYSGYDDTKSIFSC